VNSFFGKTIFRHSREGFATSSRNMKKNKKMGAQRGGKERAPYETLARVTLPFTLHPWRAVPFLQIPRLSAGSFLAAFSRDFVLCGGAEDGTATRLAIPFGPR